MKPPIEYRPKPNVVEPMMKPLYGRKIVSVKDKNWHTQLNAPVIDQQPQLLPDTAPEPVAVLARIRAQTRERVRKCRARKKAKGKS